MCARVVRGFFSRIICFTQVIILCLPLQGCNESPKKPEEWPKTTRIDYYGVWSEMHQVIAYVHDQYPDSDDPDSSGIYIIKPDGTQKRMIYRNDLTFGLDWSDDGEWLVTNANGMVVKINYYSGLADTLTSPGEHHDPVWSPDGGWIAWSWHTGDSAGIYIMDSCGTNLRQVVEDGKSVDWPYTDSLLYLNLSYDLRLGAICIADTSGSFKRIFYKPHETIAIVTPKPKMHVQTGRIVFSAAVIGETSSIWALESEGGEVRRLKTFAIRPNFSPGGDIIIFTDIHEGNGRLWIINWDGTGLRQLTY
jgi:Tol biopolymer transport system component